MPRVNPEILRWARESAGLTHEEAVLKLGLRDARGDSAISRLEALEAGTTEPSRPTLVKMAKRYRRPLLAFYMTAPPRSGERGQDFRTLPEDPPEAEKGLLDALLRDVHARQAMVRAVLEDEDEAHTLPFVDSMKVSDGVKVLLSAVKTTLDISPADYRSARNATLAFDDLRESAEECGVFVLLIGNLGSHHTALGLETFRGFALADDIAPFIVINDRDAKSAWSFTLLHEFVHLLLGQTGVSGARAEGGIERLCNDVAGEFLLPENELDSLHLGDLGKLGSLVAAIGEFARVRNLSGSMVAYKLHRAGRIDRATWRKVSKEFRSKWLETRSRRREAAKAKDGGPSYYVVRRHRVGKGLIDLVSRMQSGGALTTSKAAKVLGVKPKAVGELLRFSSPGGFSGSI